VQLLRPLLIYSKDYTPCYPHIKLLLSNDWEEPIFVPVECERIGSCLKACRTASGGEGGAMEESSFITILTTVGSQEEAEVILGHLLGERLVACVQQLEVRSAYCWKGELCRDEEVLLVMKSRAELFGQVEQCILEHHSYEVPEIISLPIITGHTPYLSWVDESLG